MSEEKFSSILDNLTGAAVRGEAVADERLEKGYGGRASVAASEPTGFKNFHRSLCARFGYTHDEQFWWRDLVSLEEHIAINVSPRAADAPSESSELRQALLDVRHAIQFSYDSVGGIDKMPVMMHHDGTVVEFIDSVLKSRAADALDSQPTYSSHQATNCAECGEHKHTPLRIDAMGGYVCLTCIDNKLGALLGEFGQQSEASAGIGEDARFGELIAAYDAAIYSTQKAVRLGSIVAYIDSRASAAPVTAIAPDAAIKIISDTQKHLVDTVRAFGDVSCAAYLSTWHKPDAIAKALGLAAPQQEGSEAGNG